jgi:uncharacterized protein YqeY
VAVTATSADMSLFERIEQDFTAAFKAGDQPKRQVLGMVKAALTNTRIAKKKENLTDDDVMAVLRKEVKSRREAAGEYRKGGAEDRALAEEAEAKALEVYLPAQMSEADLEQKVLAAIKKLGATSAKETGKVMGALSKELKGQADLKKVNELVRKHLANAAGQAS